MSQRPDNPNPFDPFDTARNVRDASMDAWSKTMQQFVNTEAYSQATANMLDAYLTASEPFRKIIQQSMTQVLQQYNMPTRSDVTAIAERLTNIEMRLDDLEAQITAIANSGQVQAQSRSTTGTSPTSASGTAAAQAMDPVVHTLSENEGSDQPTSGSAGSGRSELEA